MQEGFAGGVEDSSCRAFRTAGDRRAGRRTANRRDAAT
jgi:hypothetical protein